MMKIKKLCVLMILMFLVGTVSAQEEDPGVTPDSFLWGIDKALDNIAYLLTFDKGEKAKKGLEIANERLLEVKTMVEMNKIEEARKAETEHKKSLEKVEKSVIKLEDSEEKTVEIEERIKKHKGNVEKTTEELRAKVKVEGKITEEQQNLIDLILESMKGQAGEVEIKIKNEKGKMEIKTKSKTDEKEIEVETENDAEDALEEIREAEEEFEEFLSEADEENTDVSESIIVKFDSLIKQAKEQLEFGNFAEAKKLAEEAEEYIELEDDKLEEKKREIEIEIEEGKAEVEIKMGGSETEFELNTGDLDVIVKEISSRTGLSEEEIRKIMKVEIEEEDDEEEEEIECVTDDDCDDDEYCDEGECEDLKD